MSRPVLLINPAAGEGGRRARELAAAARQRGIEAIELRPGSDLRPKAEAAADAGASALAIAGGDGSQRLAAALAAERGIAYACVPAGTRNHFAIDLGLDRDDPVGALDALLSHAERRVDLGEVNGTPFVNNVALGLYAEAVSREDYREAKLRTALATLADAARPDGAPQELRWRDPEGGEARHSAVLLVSNNPYELASGSRPRLDRGLLGVLELRMPGGPGSGEALQQGVLERFEVDADGPVTAAIDGEPETLQPPLRFRIRPGALRVLVSRRR